MDKASRPKGRQLLLVLGLICVTALALTACGSSSSSSSSESSTAPTEGEPAAGTEEAAKPAAVAAYSGPEKGLPSEYAKPEVKKGEKFVVGYLNPNAAVEGLKEEQEGIEEQAEEYGGSVIAYDTQSDPQKQAADFKLLLSQGVTAIVLQPSDPVSLAPAVKEATDQGVPIVAVSTPADVPTPNLPDYVTNALQGEDQCAYSNMAAIAEAEPGGNFVVMGTVLPYPALEYSAERMNYWGEKLGLENLGEVQTKFADPKDGAEAMTTALAKYPEVKNVSVWLDGPALGAATTARSNGKTDIRILGTNGEKAAVEAVESGQLYSTCKYNFRELGKQASVAAYDAQTKQNLPLPEKIVVPPTAVTTQENGG